MSAVDCPTLGSRGRLSPSRFRASGNTCASRRAKLGRCAKRALFGLRFNVQVTPMRTADVWSKRGDKMSPTWQILGSRHRASAGRSPQRVGHRRLRRWPRTGRRQNRPCRGESGDGYIATSHHDRRRYRRGRRPVDDRPPRLRPRRLRPLDDCSPEPERRQLEQQPPSTDRGTHRILVRRQLHRSDIRTQHQHRHSVPQVRHERHHPS